MKHVSINLVHYHHIDDFGELSAGSTPTPRSELLKNCIESIKETIDYPAELNVWDNGGNPDDTDYLLSKVRDGTINTLVRSKNNMHFAHAWNSLAKISSGEYLSFICNDIAFRPKWLSTCVDLLERYPDRKFIATPFITYDKTKHTREILDGNRVNMRSGSNCMVIKREDFEAIGEFPRHRIGGSIWYTRMFRMGYWTIAPPEDLAADKGWRMGTNFNIPIEVKKTLLDGTEVHLEEKQQ